MRLPLACLATLIGVGAPPVLQGADGPPRERDCQRWAEAAWPARAPVEPAASGVPSAFADRAPNPDPALALPGRRSVSLELLHCEQLNLKDKLDYLVRRLSK